MNPARNPANIMAWVHYSIVWFIDYAIWKIGRNSHEVLTVMNFGSEVIITIKIRQQYAQQSEESTYGYKLVR